MGAARPLPTLPRIPGLDCFVSWQKLPPASPACWKLMWGLTHTHRFHILKLDTEERESLLHPLQ